MAIRSGSHRCVERPWARIGDEPKAQIPSLPKRGIEDVFEGPNKVATLEGRSIPPRPWLKPKDSLRNRPWLSNLKILSCAASAMKMSPRAPSTTTPSGLMNRFGSTKSMKRCSCRPGSYYRTAGSKYGVAALIFFLRYKYFPFQFLLMLRGTTSFQRESKQLPTRELGSLGVRVLTLR